jgi:hypothetical protein
VRRNIVRADKAAVEKLPRFGVATIHEAMGRIGLMKPYVSMKRDPRSSSRSGGVFRYSTMRARIPFPVTISHAERLFEQRTLW